MILALLFGLVSLGFFSVESELLYLLIVMGVGALPDIDHHKSKLGRKVKPISWLLNTLLGHRGIIHSVFPILIAYIAFSYYGYSWIGVAFAVGYFSHLVGDAFTKSGVAFLYPLSSKRIKGFIRTGGVLEELLFFVFVLLSSWQIYRLLVI